MAMKFAVGPGYGGEDYIVGGSDGGDSMYRLTKMRPGMGGHQLSYTTSEEKPAKKAKVQQAGVGGGLISRFLNSATMGYERRGVR